MSFHVPNNRRITVGQFASSPTEGNNGLFFVPLGGKVIARCIVSDGMGWEHVSVSLVAGSRKQYVLLSRCPTWEEMCKMKDTFWSDDDLVVQFHPPKSEHVNCYPYCLHLWRTTHDAIPAPPSILVGPRK